MKIPDYYKCPECKQDLRSAPHKGINDKDCSRCGQGLKWKKRMALDKKKKRSIN